MAKNHMNTEPVVQGILPNTKPPNKGWFKFVSIFQILDFLSFFLTTF